MYRALEHLVNLISIDQSNFVFYNSHKLFDMLSSKVIMKYLDKELAFSIKTVINNNFQNDKEKLLMIASFFLLCFEKDYFLVFDLH
jgi:signal recognition particle receptor subunit beta